MAAALADNEHPHSLTIHIPFPTHRLAKIALGTLSVDEELSTLVKRSFELTTTPISAPEAPPSDSAPTNGLPQALESPNISKLDVNDHEPNVLQVHYTATTPRMLRVAVNGFFESLGVILQVMEELDVDVLHDTSIEGLEGAEGVEKGMMGTAVGAGG